MIPTDTRYYKKCQAVGRKWVIVTWSMQMKKVIDDSKLVYK